MISKLQIMCLLCFWGLLMSANRQSSKLHNIPPRLLVNRSFESGDVSMGGGQQHMYLNLRAYIVNYNDDTLKYWWSNCHPTKFIAVTGSDDLDLVNEDCKNSVFEVISVPPHRSQQIQLKLAVKKYPKTITRLYVNMKFYRWFHTNSFDKAREDNKPLMLSDNITLKYNNAGGMYADRTDFAEEARKDSLNLPTSDFYLLTETDRKQYTISVDETKIGKVADTESHFKDQKIIRLPVTVHNNSNSTLKYFSMSCSWQDYYHIDNRSFNIMFSDCDHNIPTEVVVSPHSSITQTVSVICKQNSLKQTLRFRIGLNINKNVSELIELADEQLTRYNLIWSNEVTLKGS